MIIRLITRLLLAGLPALILVGVFSASAATNSVPSTRIDQVQRSVDAGDVRPAACDGLDIDELIVGTGTISGTAGSDLILGGTGDDVISGEGGDDCIVGGGGDDTLIGNGGGDVCIGGPGSDTIDATCEE
jgi:Ca2+-binding RTX toxin-like protein